MKTAPPQTEPLGVEIYPHDEHNRTLVANVHPPDWKNPDPARCYNIVVIGAGAAGLVTSAGAAVLGAKVALVERHLLGGDCLNTGCVPSKSVIRASRVKAELDFARSLGMPIPANNCLDFAAVMGRMRRIRAHISNHDAVRRFRELGVDVFLGDGHFTGPDTLEVAGSRLRFKKAVIATGARAAVPPIEGLADAGYLTNETVFNLTERPDRLLVMGGGPLGCELAQTFRRLGSQITIVEMAPQFLTREDQDAAQILARTFEREGINVRLNTRVKRVVNSGKEKQVNLETNGKEFLLGTDTILVGVGRAPNVEGLGLAAAGVKYDSRAGVYVNERLQTTNPRIYAAGDVCLAHKVTQSADATALLGMVGSLDSDKALGMLRRLEDAVSVLDADNLVSRRMQEEQGFVQFSGGTQEVLLLEIFQKLPLGSEFSPRQNHFCFTSRLNLGHGSPQEWTKVIGITRSSDGMELFES